MTPVTTSEARLLARELEGGLCGFRWGSCCAAEEKDRPGALTLHCMIAEGVQRNSSVQFVGSHSLTSSPEAAC